MRSLLKNSLFAIVATCLISTSANAALLNISFDDTNNETMEGNIVGTGTVSFDGALSEGDFVLNTLNNFQLSIDWGGNIFTEEDIISDSSLTSLRLFEDAGSFFGFFVGASQPVGSGGSLELNNGNGGAILSFQSDISDFSTEDSTRRYGGATSLLNFIGTYQLTAPAEVPETASVAILALGLAGMGLARRRMSVA